jgi:hypothetical protein
MMNPEKHLCPSACRADIRHDKKWLGGLSMLWGRSVCFTVMAALLVPVLSLSQNNEHNDGEVAPGSPSKYYTYLLDGGIELTYPVTPLSLQQYFNGVYAAHISLSQKIYKGFYAGLELQSAMASEQPAVAFPIATIATNMYLYNGAIKLTYCTPETNDFLFGFSAAGGLSWIKFNSIPGWAPQPPAGEWYGKNVPFYSAQVSGGYVVDDQLCLSITLSYAIYNYSFDPQRMGILQVYPASQTGGVSYFQWGFGIEYLFGAAK